MRHTNRKIVAGLAGIATMFLIAGTSLSAGPASAEPDRSVCTVSGSASVTGETNNVPPTKGNTNGSFTGTTITCQPPVQTGNDDGGAWTGIAATFKSNGDEDCSGGTGLGYFTAGTAPNGASGDGTVSAGSYTATFSVFTYTRTGTSVVVTGDIKTSNGEDHQFTATLQFAPTAGPCIGGTGTTTALLNGAAHVTE